MAILGCFCVALTLAGAGLDLSVLPAAAQSVAPPSGLASVRARLIGANGTLLVAPGGEAELYAGTLSAAEVPELLALARECTVLTARTSITLTASLGAAPVQVKIERDKGGRLEVQMRGIPFPDRVRFLEVADSFLARGVFDVRVEGPVAGKNIEVRVHERAPEGPAISTAALPPPTPGAADAGPPVELYGRWRSTTLPVAVLTLRPAAGGVVWEYESPRSGGLTWGRGTVRADGSGAASAEALALSGQITSGDEAPGRSSFSAMRLVLRQEGASLRGTAIGSRNHLLTIEFVKDSGP